MDKEKFHMDGNTSYASNTRGGQYNIYDEADLRSTSHVQVAHGSRSIRCTCLRLVVAILAAVVILGTASACVYFAVEIEQLKSETADCQNITLLSSSIQELKRDLMTLMQISTLPSSCAALPSSSPSGYYLISPSSGSGPVSVYCDMDRTCGGVTGGWMRVAKLDMTDSSQSCTNGLVQRNFNSSLRLCARPEVVSGCTSLNFTANDVPYSKVCGRVRGYQYGVLDAFRVYFNNFRRSTLEDFYAYGAVLTHGHPRQHIWTFVAARDELVTHNWSGCLCLRPNFPEPPPPFIGNDYFCDTGSREHFRTDTFYGDDPLWDGAGCESTRGFNNTCCTFNTPPWFYRQLPQLTTDDVEMRVCRATENISDLGIESFEIYVQ